MSESVGTVPFTVTLSAASGLSVTVSYSSTNQSAIAGSDYTAVSDTLTIPAGQTSVTGTVSISDDALDEADESFRLDLSNATNATISDSQAVVTIIDNDLTVTVTDSGQALGREESYGVELADLDGDSDLDAFIVNGSTQADTVWLNDGNGTFTDSGQALGSSDGRGVALGDINNDGDLDAFVSNWQLKKNRCAAR